MKTISEKLYDNALVDDKKSLTCIDHFGANHQLRVTIYKLLIQNKSKILRKHKFLVYINNWHDNKDHQVFIVADTLTEIARVTADNCNLVKTKEIFNQLMEANTDFNDHTVFTNKL